MEENIEFGHILDIYYEKIYSYVYRLVEDVHEAQDLTQEIFLKVYKNINKYNSKKASIKTWIYKISTNHVINLKKKKKHIFLDKVDFIKSDEDIIYNLISEEKNVLVVDSINRYLNKKYKRIMLLYIFSELTPKEISSTMDVPLKSVYNAISVSTQKIKNKLEGKL